MINFDSFVRSNKIIEWFRGGIITKVDNKNQKGSTAVSEATKAIAPLEGFSLHKVSTRMWLYFLRENHHGCRYIQILDDVIQQHTAIIQGCGYRRNLPNCRIPRLKCAACAGSIHTCINCLGDAPRFHGLESQAYLFREFRGSHKIVSRIVHTHNL